MADDKISNIFSKLKFNTNSGYMIYILIFKEKRFEAQYGGILSSSTDNEAFIALQYNNFLKMLTMWISTLISVAFIILLSYRGV